MSWNHGHNNLILLGKTPFLVNPSVCHDENSNNFSQVT